MKLPDDRIKLQHIADFAGRAIGFISDVTREEFNKDEVLQYACVHLLEIIGEAANGLTGITRDLYPNIPWLKMINMRNRLIHGYIDIDMEIVWQTIKYDLPPLVDQVQKIKLDE
jgi:uncharacterized protein with HEPN domain